MQDKPLLKLENINFGYGKKALLKKANLAIYAGQSIGIVGDNGTGKSTIVKLILGLIRPEYGKIELFGKPASWKNAHPNLGYIGDPSHNSGELGLPDGILVEEMVECFRVLCEIPSPSGTNNKQSSQDLWDLPPGDFFEQLIDLLKIKTFYSRDVGRLSNGERKKLMTLLAIGKQPDLLIADEATEGLDKTAKPTALVITVRDGRILSLPYLPFRFCPRWISKTLYCFKYH
jgi:zinc transport system ATP-binding protein